MSQLHRVFPSPGSIIPGVGSTRRRLLDRGSPVPRSSQLGNPENDTGESGGREYEHRSYF